MAKKWIRRLAPPAAMILVLTTCATSPADATKGPVSYRCTTMSLIFYNPLGENFVIASGCDGPKGTFRNVIFLDPPPYSAGFCTWAYAYQPDGAEGLNVTGHSCA